MRNNEDTTAALGDSEVSSVQHSPGPAIPALPKPFEKGTEIPSFPTGQDTHDILPDEPARPLDFSNSEILDGQVTTRISHSFSLTLTRERERLARGAADENIERRSIPGRVSWVEDFREIAIVGNPGVVVREDCAGESVDFAEPRGLPAEWVPSGGCRFDS